MSFNEEIKTKIDRLPVNRTILAYKIGISRSTLFSWLEIPLTDERRSKILNAIQELESNGVAE